jgi:hypothetical protein
MIAVAGTLSIVPASGRPRADGFELGPPEPERCKVLPLTEPARA